MRTFPCHLGEGEFHSKVSIVCESDTCDHFIHGFRNNRPQMKQVIIKCRHLGSCIWAISLLGLKYHFCTPFFGNWIWFGFYFISWSSNRDVEEMDFKNPSYWQSSGHPELNMNPELRLLISLKALKVYFLVLQQKLVGRMDPLCSAYFTEEKVRPRAVEGFDPRSQNERTEWSVNGGPTENLIFNN